MSLERRRAQLLRGAAFIESNLKGASLHHATIRSGWLSRAQLDYAGLENTDLTGSKLAEAHINDSTKLNGSNWWNCNFYLPIGNGTDVDAPLLEKLFEKYGNEVPKDANELHVSVRKFIEAKEKISEAWRIST